ncbi:smr domain-containing protein [Blastomyces gilchristii SLH14081]|uniref:Smr domain-containing protein n=1 Tax=Blastomyces gilchristii (strain SLH14081) TaxID=559298 RepID=A0A179UKI7_BLAGS|nr:smr domain-containing protein [Blastomyces gilchristii SLH14081]OAT08400.1 smr domain-containing protein [Blastomyces gilchristii SLH14081]
MDEPVESLMKGLEYEYCPPLDPALFVAIASDYNLLDEDTVRQLRDTLDALKASADEQENTAFDPSGTSGQGHIAGDQDELASEQDGSHPTLDSLTSNLTSLESDFSAASLGENQNPSHYGGLWSGHHTDTEQPSNRVSRIAGLTAEGKMTYLMDMFPSIDQYTILHTLRKCGEDIDRSMDVLLNLAFFEDQSADDQEGRVSIPKGIDGFESNIQSRGRKRTRNKQSSGKQASQRQMRASSALTHHKINKVDNKWENSKRDVDFICSRTYLSPNSVTSAYHLNGASLPNTLHSLASTEAEQHAKAMMNNSVTITQITELQQEFHKVSPEKLAGLLRLARNSTSAASELATVMITVKPPPLARGIVQIKQAPINLDDSPAHSQKTPSWTPQPRRDHLTSRSIADSHIIAGHSAFNKANSAYRRAKSDHLMGGAAGYYSAVGRDHMEKAKKEAAAAADALVESQSNSRLLDLHGVSVQHAVSIVKRKVEAWWDSLGDTKYAPGGWGPVQEGYRIITGLGRHSRNGTARVGPAVARALANEGWKVEVGEGYLTVMGMARRR